MFILIIISDPNFNNFLFTKILKHNLVFMNIINIMINFKYIAIEVSVDFNFVKTIRFCLNE